MLLVCTGFRPAQAEPVLSPPSTLVWTMPEVWFGGFSGAEVSDGGKALTLITDKGNLVLARLNRTQGTLSSVDIVEKKPLTHPSGRPLSGKETDAEGLATAEDGTAFVSFEHQHRVTRLDIQTGKVGALKQDKTFANLNLNEGLEALALHPDGTLFTLPERSIPPTGPAVLYALRGGAWQPAVTLPKRGAFLPVGADFDADGNLYLLERSLSPLGFRSRIRRFTLDAPDLAEVTLMTSWPSQYDNLEAISVWVDAAGVTHLTLVSDDNFFAIQQTQIIEFTVTE